MKEQNYPFSALIGQEDMKLALLLNAINPRIGGVLIQGDKGTAKSTAVRALGNVLSEGVQESMKVVELPLHCTEDRLVGSLDVERILGEGKQVFAPGLLQEAHGNILYVDEINLLEDHLVDTLLDVAAMGVNRVERDGISHSHPSRFILIGTMNPEEGEVRPQLLDRFGLSVMVKAERDVEKRFQILEHRLAFEEDPQTFIETYALDEQRLRERISKARHTVTSIVVSKDILTVIANVAIALGVEGHRFDITLLQTAMALGAYEESEAVTLEHVRRVTPLVALHRMKRKPFEERRFDESLLEGLWAKYGVNHD